MQERNPVLNIEDFMLCLYPLFKVPLLLMITGVYGDVVRVKILYNKRDSALIQFKEPQHAQTGRFRTFVSDGSLLTHL